MYVRVAAKYNATIEAPLIARKTATIAPSFSHFNTYPEVLANYLCGLCEHKLKTSLFR